MIDGYVWFLSTIVVQHYHVLKVQDGYWKWKMVHNGGWVLFGWLTILQVPTALVASIPTHLRDKQSWNQIIMLLSSQKLYSAMIMTISSTCVEFFSDFYNAFLPRPFAKFSWRTFFFSFLPLFVIALLLLINSQRCHLLSVCVRNLLHRSYATHFSYHIFTIKRLVGP